MNKCKRDFIPQLNSNYVNNVIKKSILLTSCKAILYVFLKKAMTYFP